jgi:multiple sugar transport system ATP-binding protein
MAEIDFDRVSKRFGDGPPAVDQLSLHINDGEFMVLVGPSGCGKTTALRMLAGLEEISSGTLKIGGAVVNDTLPKDRDVAMVFQNYALYPHMTVEKNIGFALKVRGDSKDEIKRKVDEAAAILRLDDYLERKPKALSGGQRQRVAMGRAIVRSPQAFLMDEPLSNLDAKLRVEMRLEIARIQRLLNVATVYVTHDQVEAMTMGDRVAVMRAGQLQQVDTPQNLYDRPANEFVAGFMGSPPMNLLPCQILANGDRIEVILGDQRIGLPTSYAASHELPSSGARAVFGARPEDVHITDASTANSLRVRVERCEALGSEILVHLSHHFEDAPAAGSGRELSQRASLIAKLGPRAAVKAGDVLAVTISPAHAHFFDVESGDSLRRSAS